MLQRVESQLIRRAPRALSPNGATRVFTALLTDDELESAYVVIESVDPATESVVLRNATTHAVSIAGWTCQVPPPLSHTHSLI